MKALVNKILWLTIGFVCILAFPARAQQMTAGQEEKTIPVGDFSSISVSDDFEVSLVKGKQGVKVTSEKELIPYIQVYVRSKTLFISYDEKSVPKDTRKLFKRRGASDPVFRAVVSMPELGGISLSNNATLSAVENFGGNNLEINLADKAQVKTLSAHVNAATLTMKKNAQASVNIEADSKLTINTEGNAELKLGGKAQEIAVDAAGSYELTLAADCKTSAITTSGTAELSLSQKAEKISLNAGGYSKLNLSGEADVIQLQGERSASVEANAFTVKKAEANLSGSAKVNISITESLDATLVGGSALYYTGTPSIKIGKIIKSTLAPYGSTAK